MTVQITASTRNDIVSRLRTVLETLEEHKVPEGALLDAGNHFKAIVDQLSKPSVMGADFVVAIVNTRFQHPFGRLLMSDLPIEVSVYASCLCMMTRIGLTMHGNPENAPPPTTSVTFVDFCMPELCHEAMLMDNSKYFPPEEICTEVKRYREIEDWVVQGLVDRHSFQGHYTRFNRRVHNECMPGTKQTFRGEANKLISFNLVWASACNYKLTRETFLWQVPVGDEESCTNPAIREFCATMAMKFERTNEFCDEALTELTSSLLAQNDLGVEGDEELLKRFIRKKIWREYPDIRLCSFRDFYMKACMTFPLVHGHPDLFIARDPDLQHLAQDPEYVLVVKSDTDHSKFMSLFSQWKNDAARPLRPRVRKRARDESSN